MSENEPPINPVTWDIHETHPDLVPVLREKLSEVVDPEIGINVIQLGLIRKVSVEDGASKVYVLLTTPFCPYGPAMLENTRQKAEEALGMPANMDLGMDMWDFSMMEEGLADGWGLY